jgi:Holliday junction resolvase RusA-like endonuclease
MTAAPGRLLCRLVIDDLRAAPWGVYTKSCRWSEKARLKAWQLRVAAEARLVTDMTRPAYRGPVAIRLTFFTAPLRLHQQVCDTSNLQKAAEDAVKGIVFEDDRQVWDIHSTRLESARDRTILEVWAMEPPRAGEED